MLSLSCFAVEEIVFLTSLKDMKVTKINETVVFECEVSKSNARAIWIKDGNDIISDRKYDITVQGNSHRLTIRNVDSTDAGDYTINIKGHRSAARLEVEAKPEIYIDEKYKKPVKLKAGSSLTIEVPFTGSPQPKATWRFNGEPIRESRRMTGNT